MEPVVSDELLEELDLQETLAAAAARNLAALGNAPPITVQHDETFTTSQLEMFETLINSAVREAMKNATGLASSSSASRLSSGKLAPVDVLPSVSGRSDKHDHMLSFMTGEVYGVSY